MKICMFKEIRRRTNSAEYMDNWKNRKEILSKN